MAAATRLRLGEPVGDRLGGGRPSCAAAGIGVEAGLAAPAEAEELSRSAFSHQILRALVEVDGGAPEALAVSQLIPDGVSQLWHGYGERTWEVIAAGASAGFDVRVGLEDVLVLPDGRVAADNAELVTAAVELVAERT